MIATLLLLTQLQFASGSLDTKPNNHLPFKLDSTNSCIFYKAFTQTGKPPEEFFVLTETEKILIDSLLQQSMKDNFHELYEFRNYTPDYSDTIHFNFDNFINTILSRYSYQLIPYIDTRGDKYVWVNCVRTHRKDFCDYIVFVHDGGDAYFNLYLNLSKMTFCCFQVNGDE